VVWELTPARRGPQANNTILMYATDIGAKMMSWPDGGTTPFRRGVVAAHLQGVPTAPEASQLRHGSGEGEAEV